MANLIYLDDLDNSICVAVNMDTLTPLPILAAGPNRYEWLAGFVADCPFDVTELDDDSMRAAFLSYLEARNAFQAPDATDVQGGDMVAVDGAASNGEGKLADAEATNSTEVPAPQPADTDTDTDTATKTIKVPCWNCDGSGMVAFGDGSPARTCGICKGAQYVEQEVPA